MMSFSIYKTAFSLIAIALLAIGTLSASGSHNHASHAKKSNSNMKIKVKGTQKVCPIRKEAIDTSVYVDHQGQRVYFCCGGCDTKFLKDTDKYFAEMKTRGEIADSIQKLCPVTGDVLEDYDTSLTLAGRKIYLCCKKCVKKFKKDKAKYLKNMTGKAPMKKSMHDHSGHKH
jgi:YHS domain-containing protein